MIRRFAACLSLLTGLLTGLILFAATPATAAEPPAETPAAIAGDEAHLASYRHKADAERGWKVLSEAYSSVLYFHPVIREVDLPGKGHFFRLFADGDQVMVESLCRSMHERKLYCVLMPQPSP